MPTEKWAEVKLGDENFEVFGLNFHGKDILRNNNSNKKRNNGLNKAVDSFQGLSVDRSSCSLDSDESSLTCNDRSSEKYINKKLNDKENQINKNIKNKNNKPIDEISMPNDSKCKKNNSQNSEIKFTKFQDGDIKSFIRSSYGSDKDDNGEDEDDEDDEWIVDKLVMSTSILPETNPPSFMLLNHNEQLMMDVASSFTDLLNIDSDTKVKVVSIIGNTGEGKSHTMNETFCEGKHVFRTSSRQQAATIGCWAAYDPLHHAILLDTEGMLNNNQPIRLLLKVMAVSDVVIYRTRSERLHSDMFHFLGDACTLLHTHFSPYHHHPSIIISHHTQHTELLAKGSREEASSMIKRRFEYMDLTYKHYSDIHYIASKMHIHHASNDETADDSRRGSYSELLLLVKQLLSNHQLYASRSPQEVFEAIKTLNDRFSGPLPPSPSSSHQIFLCHSSCLSCQASCEETMNHHNHPHHTTSSCIPNKLLNNTLYLCKKCLSRGNRRVVQAPLTGIASYAWSGYILECGHCGVIYRSREHWYGNADPEDEAVVMVTEHVWPGYHLGQQGSSIESNMAQRVLDGVAGVSGKLAGPSKYVCEWMADQINPPYWEPNHLIKTCRSCGVSFSEVISIHHCRACGRGFCEACSSKSRPVPEMRWGEVAVRVCDRCFHHPPNPNPSPLTSHPAGTGENDVIARRVGEVVGSTIGAVSSILNYPIAALKEAARPDYWVPDEEANNCFVCKRPFKNQQTTQNNNQENNKKHHPTPKNHHKNHHHSTQSPISPFYISYTNTNKSNNKTLSNNSNSDDNRSVHMGDNSNPQSPLPLKLHHCRSCGQGVCGDCSGHAQEVASRGWHHAVRVCDLCYLPQTSSH